MRRFPLFLLLLLSLAGHSSLAAETIGFRQVMLPADTSGRALSVSLWYPAARAAAPQTFAENAIFHGFSAVADATPESGARPLVVLSHGMGGNWRKLSWLAAALAGQGYAVAAPDHPGTTTFGMDPPEKVALWERPRDISRVIDALIADRTLAGGIAVDRIAAIGHSLGGWTVAELAGGRFEAGRIMPDCGARFSAVACKTYGDLGIGRDAGSDRMLGGDLQDGRIRAFVSLDLGPTQGFTPESLARIDTPFLVIAAEADIAEPVATKAMVAASNRDSAYLAVHLPVATARLVTMPGTTHFSFMQRCKPGAIALIEEEAPGEGIVCEDVGRAPREDIHTQTGAMIIAFLAKALPPT